MKKLGAFTPPQLLLIVFILSITAGTLLLKLPLSYNGELSWLDAFFTSVSAMTVTGLAVVDTGTVFTLFGQTIIMLLIQLGGIGIMTFAVLFFLLLGKKIGLKERLIIQQSLNQNSAGGIIRLAIHLSIFAFIVEGFAVVILSTVWVPELGLAEGIFFSVFHAVSAFNNAGFGLKMDSLMGYAGDPIINIVISGLFVLGGIGFTVILDVWRSSSIRKWSLHTKVMILGTLIINVISMLYLFINEFENPLTLGGLPLDEKLWTSYFQAVSPRTAGFNTIDIAGLDDSSILYIILLMFIGAGSTSTGGGIKVTTFIIILLATISFFRRKAEINIFNREIRQELVFKSLAIAMSSVLLVVFALLILTHSEHHITFIELLFETVSAFGTVGLSMGITGGLSEVGKVVLIVVMFVGKIGPLTLAFSLAKPDHSKIKYPKSDVLAG
ncbi:TrkH family potassium uptake protein [Jeotgalibacillus proteolyticus]|uniref:Ktr system potassium transporter B n=1 Tax=Jeotgalibacillus proteolyticus TaxID=2082395 RepID=A0A2S5G7F5_9BACL|nr:TrkH family potassium uptake protein [Jeotgalibacillus proteolyticus]PPA68910.1 Ktr system potassium transporter B [Jeotgalibacillus proteolyticus]